MPGDCVSPDILVNVADVPEFLVLAHDFRCYCQRPGVDFLAGHMAFPQNMQLDQSIYELCLGIDLRHKHVQSRLNFRSNQHSRTILLRVS